MSDQMRKGRGKTIQQMFNLDDAQTLTQTLLMDIDDKEMITPIDSRDSLNLKEVEMTLPHFIRV